MEEIKDLAWFKNVITPTLKGYEVVYRFFEKGDFGSLNQVLFNSSKLGGEVDFWERDFLSIHLWDYEKNVELLNVFLEPEEYTEKEKAFEELQRLLK